jgi:hypothetical protein
MKLSSHEGVVGDCGRCRWKIYSEWSNESLAIDQCTGNERTQPSDTLPPQLFEAHLVSDIAKEICFFGDASNECRFKGRSFLHNLFRLRLDHELWVSSSGIKSRREKSAHFGEYVFIDQIFELKKHLPSQGQKANFNSQYTRLTCSC